MNPFNPSISKLQVNPIPGNMTSYKSVSLVQAKYTAHIFTGLILFSLSLVLLLGMAASVHAQIPAPKQNQPIALTGGTVYTVSGDVIENGIILFEGGLITAIGQNVEIPSNTEEIDITGKEVWPGLIDSYSRMGIFEIGAVDMTVDINEAGRFNPNVTPQVAFNPESRHIGTARTNGVLTAVTTPGGGIISGQSSAMMLDGWSWEEMVIESLTGMLINWPSPGDDYEKTLQELGDFFADARSYQTAARAFKEGNGPRHNKDSRLEAMGDVLEGEQPVFVVANDLRQIQDAITWSEDENLNLVIIGGQDAHYITDHLAEKEIPVIITSVLDAPDRDREGYDSSYSLPSKLYNAGVTFAIAGSSSAPYSFRLANEAGAAAAYGLDLEEAVQAVTHSPAKILGIDDRVGSLEEGKHATLLITTGNPLEYSSEIEQAYIQGRKIDMVDAHRALYEKYRQKIEQTSDR